ncbi:MFS transporter [Agromyces rhizosphaerae]|uniref:MFS transporter n=1 Tax=Agromyces rhizosphaerae TaxID=88374 RepID=A0A9W6CWT0_9MICO|nr:MFS transporter [Agromyces rhizosphaerae]GLI27110.1 MFS transporter [Agromyces rhizosphaerae]
MTTTGTAPATARTAGRGAVGLLVLTELGSGILQGWYGPLLVGIGDMYSVGAATLNLVAVAYLLSSVLFVPLLTKLADMHGHKKLLMIAVGITALGSLLVAFAPNFGVLLVGRVLQGALVAFLPLEFAIVRQRAPEQVGKSIGQLVASLAIGALLGAVGSGVLYGATDSLVLVLTVPAIYFAVCLVLIAFFVPETDVTGGGRLDWAGVALLGFGAAGLLGGISLAGVSGWGDPLAWVLMVAGAALLAAWVVVEKRVADPFIDLDVLRHGGIGLPIVIGVLYGAHALGGTSLIAIFVAVDPDEYGFGLGLSAAMSGIILSAMALSGFAGSLLANRLVGWFSTRTTLLIAHGLGATAFLGMILASGNLALFMVWLVLGGLGMGFVISVLPTVVVSLARHDEVAVVSGLYNTARTAAGAAAGAVFTTVMAAFIVAGTDVDGSAPVTSFTGYAAVWAIGAGLAVIGGLLTLRLPKNPTPATDAAESTDAVEQTDASEAAPAAG